jgi:hypothetical protein
LKSVQITTNFSIIRAIIALMMMEAAGTSETPVNSYQTSRCNIPEDNHLHQQVGLHIYHLFVIYLLL